MTARPWAKVRGWLALLVSLLAGTAGMPAAVAGRPAMLAAADGTALAATFHETDAKPAPAVVLVHMLHRSRADWDGIGAQLAAVGIAALAIDLRGHGGSGGQAGDLTGLSEDVRAAVDWLAARPDVRPDAVAVAGASLGANLALLVAAEVPAVRVAAAVSPGLDYRGVRVGPDVLRRIGERPVWLAASTEDPFALRTLKELTADGPGPREQYLSAVTAHGSNLLAQDAQLARALVDWLRQRLLS